MRYKIEPVSSPDEQEVLDDERFVAIASCPRCGTRWKSSEPLRPGDPNGLQKQGARRVEMLSQLRGGCRNCSSAGLPRERQHGRLRSAWPGSRR